MNCRDFQRIWNEQFDARAATFPEVEQALQSHATACPSCRAASRGYQTLLLAIQTVGPPLAPPTDLVERILSSRDATSPPRAGRFRPLLVTLALAASLLLAVFWSGRGARKPPDGGAQQVVTVREPKPAQPAPPDLTGALADASSATWRLARAASAPAARIGRDMIDSAVALKTPTTLPDPTPKGSATEIMQNVGERVGERVRPLSGTARQAFGFLLGPAAKPAAHGA